MDRVVFVLLLASWFATGLGLNCYQCASDLSVFIPGIGSLSFINNENCNTNSFDPNGMNTVTGTSSEASGTSLLKPDYCIKMVVSFKGLVGVTIRGVISSSAIFNPEALLTDSVVSATNSSLDTDDLLNNPRVDLMETLMNNIEALFDNPPASLGDIDVALCDTNMCNSVSGLRHSNEVLAVLSAVVLMATLANNFN